MSYSESDMVAEDRSVVHTRDDYNKYFTALTTANSKDTDTDNVNSGSCGLSGDLNIAISTSITAFVVGSILFFITGFLCRHFCQKGKTETVQEVQGLTYSYYGNVVIQKQEQELELNENVASRV